MSDLQPAPTRAQFKPVREIKTIEEALRHPSLVERFKEAIPRHLSPERMLRVFTLAVQKTPKLKECDLWTLLGAMMALASLGMEPNTPLGLAYLIPFGKRTKNQSTGKWEDDGCEVQVIIGYRGYIELARRAGSLVSLHADVVYEGDEFSFEYGSKAHLRHVPKGSREGRTPLWAYAHARLSDGEAFEVLPHAQVLKIRDNSQGYISALRVKSRFPESFAKNPWVAFEHEMVAKTMVRRISKMLPMTIEMANAAQLDAMSEGGKADFAAIAQAAPSSSVSDMLSIGQEEYIPAFDINGGGTEDLQTADIDDTRQEQQQTQQQRRDPPRQEQTRQDPPRQEQRQETRQETQRQDPPHQVTEPTRTTAPTATAAAAAITYYLVDEEGVVITQYGDAVQYIRGLENHMLAAAPELREAIIENNGPSIEDAENHPVAKIHLDQLRHQLANPPQTTKQPEQQQDVDPMLVAMPKRGEGQDDLKGYVANAKASLETMVTDLDSAAAWYGANKPIYTEKKSIRGIVDQMFADRKTALGLDRPQQQQQQQQTSQDEITAANDGWPGPKTEQDGPPGDEPPPYGEEQQQATTQTTAQPAAPDRDRMYASDLIASLLAATTINGISAIQTAAQYKVLMERWARERRTLHDEVLKAATDRRDVIQSSRI